METHRRTKCIYILTMGLFTPNDLDNCTRLIWTPRVMQVYIAGTQSVLLIHSSFVFVGSNRSRYNQNITTYWLKSCHHSLLSRSTLPIWWYLHYENYSQAFCLYELLEDYSIYSVPPRDSAFNDFMDLCAKGFQCIQTIVNTSIVYIFSLKTKRQRQHFLVEKFFHNMIFFKLILFGSSHVNRSSHWPSS